MAGVHASRPKVGEKVTITHIADREFSAFAQSKWVAYPLPKEREGIYIGFRTKYNGYTVNDEGARYFVQENGVRVWMVVLDERENPVPVFPEHVYKV